jgi:hypothetical protein
VSSIFETHLKTHRLNLRFHELIEFTIRSDHEQVFQGIAFDFQGFASSDCSPAVQSLNLSCFLAASVSIPPGARLVRERPTYSAYNVDGVRWIRYFDNRAVLSWDYKNCSGSLWCQEVELSIEVCYLTVLALVGELLDKQGFHRLHASAVAIDGNGILCAMDSGGGKTSLLLAALQLPQVKVLSDDCPLVSRKGHLYGFPLRIGERQAPSSEIPQAYVRHASFEEHGVKWLVNFQYFTDRYVSQASPILLLIGTRGNAKSSSVSDSSIFNALSILMRNLILGVGLRQGPELILQYDGFDWFRLGRNVTSRCIAACMLLVKMKFRNLYLSSVKSESLSFYRALVSDTAHKMVSP